MAVKAKFSYFQDALVASGDASRDSLTTSESVGVTTVYL